MLKYTIFLFFIIYSCTNKEVVTPNPIENPETEIDTACVPFVDIPLGDSLFYPSASKGLAPYGSAIANRDSLDWEAAAEARIHTAGVHENTPYFYIAAYEQLSNRIRNETIFFYTPYELGCYPLLNISLGEYSLPEGEFIKVSMRIVNHDVSLKRYVLDTTADNYFELLKMDTVNNLAEGRFMMTFLGDEDKSGEYGPDTLRYFNGYVSCELVE